jgi:oligogalacturonide transport system permease protein
MRAIIKALAIYAILIALGILLVYPLLFLVGASFKTNQEIMTSAGILPARLSLDAYREGWRGTGQFTYGRFFLNTFALVVPTVIFTLVSSTIVAYGFARFKFRFHNVLFMLMISTLMLPSTTVIIPRYLLFRSLGWLDGYLPFIVPAIFACYPFFIFAMVQFLRGIPRELDESAIIDGSTSMGILVKIIVPLCTPALFSVGIFQFIWTWNDFFNVLIYVNSVSKYPLALALRMSMDAENVMRWDKVMAMSFLTMLPCILIFFFAQKYFVEGIATTGLKG